MSPDPSGTSPRRSPDGGSVIVEAALVIPVLLAVAVLLVWVMSLGATYVRVLDIAQTAARQAARGVADVQAPEGVVVDVSESDGLVHARAWTDVRPPLASLVGWSITVQADAHAASEWTGFAQ